MTSRAIGFRALAILLLASASVSGGSLGANPGWKQQVHHVTPKPKPAPKAAGGRVGVKQVQYPGSPYTIQSLLALRAQNPALFDRRNPTIGRLLERDQRLRGADCSQQHNGLLSLTPYHRYLIYRRSLDPQRFDTYHPMLGPIIAEDQRLRNVVCQTSPQILLPPPISYNNPGPTPGPTPPGPPAGQMNGIPPTPPPKFVPVPEPSGLVLLALGTSALAVPGLVRRVRRRAGGGRVVSGRWSVVSEDRD